MRAKKLIENFIGEGSGQPGYDIPVVYRVSFTLGKKKTTEVVEQTSRNKWSALARVVGRVFKRKHQTISPTIRASLERTISDMKANPEKYNLKIDDISLAPGSLTPDVAIRKNNPETSVSLYQKR